MRRSEIAATVWNARTATAAEESLRAPADLFITTCTQQRRPLLNNESIHEALKTFAKDGTEHGAWIGAYVIMPDHLHLFVVIDDEQLTLPSWMKALKGVLSKALRDRGVSPPYWQKGYSIMHCAALNLIRGNGIMFATIQFVPDWYRAAKTGPTSGKSSIWHQPRSPVRIFL